MQAATRVSLRELARLMPMPERKERLAQCERLTTPQLLRAVVSTAVGAGEWYSVQYAADNVFVVAPETLRKWLRDNPPEIPKAIREKLLKLAWAFGIEPKRG